MLYFKMEKEIDIKGKKLIVKEIPYIEAVDIDPENKKEMVVKLFKASLGLTEEEINALTMREGKEIEQAIAEVNGINLTDFQNPTEKGE